MLKEYNNLYFSLNKTWFIKLKKDYIVRLRNIADLMIINKHCNIKDEQKLNIERLL